jgi:hypothetical protein
VNIEVQNKRGSTSSSDPRLTPDVRGNGSGFLFTPDGFIWLKSRSGYRHLSGSCAVANSLTSILWQKNHARLPSRCVRCVQYGAAEPLIALIQLSRGILCCRQNVGQIGIPHQQCPVSSLTCRPIGHCWSKTRLSYYRRFAYAKAGITSSPKSFRDFTTCSGGIVPMRWLAQKTSYPISL